MKRLSIIIPVNNNETSIEKCINSILEQEYSNIEIIVVNNGSVDDSLEVIKSIAKRENRVIPIDTKIKGVSNARNIGIKQATGDYITFVDADDFVEKGIYKEMIDSIEMYKAEISFCAYYRINGNKKNKIMFPWKEKIKILENDEIIKSFIPLFIGNSYKHEPILWGCVWRTLIRADIAKKIYFDIEIKIAEDLLYIIDLLSVTTKIVVLNIPLYNYVKNDKSTLMNFKENYEKGYRNFQEKLIFRLQKINFFNNNNNKLRYSANRVAMYMYLISNEAKNKKISKKEQMKFINRKIKEFSADKYICDKVSKVLSGKKKIFYILMKIKQKYIIWLTFKLNKIIRY